MHPNDKNKKVDSSVTLCKFGCNVSISPLFERLFHKNHLARVRRTSRFGLKYKQWLEMSGSLLKKHPFYHQKHSCKCVHVAFKLFSGVTLTNPETQIQIAPNLQPRCLSLTSHQKLINTYKRKKKQKTKIQAQVPGDILLCMSYTDRAVCSLLPWWEGADSLYGGEFLML